MKLAQLGKLIKNQLVEAVINMFANTEIKIIKNVEEFHLLVANFVLSIIYRMRSKSFRRKHGKMSRRRRGGQEKETSTPIVHYQGPQNTLYRQTTADYLNMEEGFAPTAPPMEEVMPPATNPITMLGRSNTDELVSMEEGTANPQVAIDVELTPDIEMGSRSESGGRRKRTRKARKGRKSRKGGKRRRSHRR